MSKLQEKIELYTEADITRKHMHNAEIREALEYREDVPERLLCCKQLTSNKTKLI